MIKRTLYFGNASHLSQKHGQLVIRLSAIDGNPSLAESLPAQGITTIPIEDIGVMIIDNPQVTLTSHLISELLANNVALVMCNQQHMPTGLMLNLSGNQLQSAKFRSQLDASLPILKNLWQQTIRAKIQNQARLLTSLGIEAGNLSRWAEDVKSGDPDNLEARAAAYYWKNLFPDVSGFIRERDGIPPNDLLNYTYAILRAIVARSLVGSGLLPIYGIHHHNQYNHYCLADDIMEPYRPFADNLVRGIVHGGQTPDLNTDTKRTLLAIASQDTRIDGRTSPLMVAVQRTTASLVECFEGTARKLLYGELPL
ncbi:MAG: type II CRISPR-associated endonuclease Cas1 [Cyclobacteriaceae bacterium]